MEEREKFASRLSQTRSRAENADHHDNAHPEDQLGRIGQHRCEHAGNASCIEAIERARCALENVVQHPAGHHRVKHHQHVVAGEPEPFQHMPPRTGRFKRLERTTVAALAGAADGKLHHHDGKRESD